MGNVFEYRPQSAKQDNFLLVLYREKGLKGKTIIKHSRRIYLKARISYYNIPIVFKKLFDKYNGLIDTSVYSPRRVLFVPLSDRKKNLIDELK